MTHTLTADDFLAGTRAVYDIPVPSDLLKRGEGNGVQTGSVRITPLNIGTFQLILKAAKDDPGLIPVLMIKESLKEPALKTSQIKSLNLGLILFLVDNIREISGLSQKKN